MAEKATATASVSGENGAAIAPGVAKRQAGPHVYEAIALVQSDLSKQGIQKLNKNAQQGFVFRGIDDIYNALAGFLSLRHLCIIPRVVSRTATERPTKAGGVQFSVVVEAEYDFMSAVDGSKHTAKVYGEAMDSGDKGTSKAMSAAFKYLCLQTFCIPTEAESPDADATTPPELKPIDPRDAVMPILETAAKKGTAGLELVWKSLTPKQREACADDLAGLKTTARTFDAKAKE